MSLLVDFGVYFWVKMTAVKKINETAKIEVKKTFELVLLMCSLVLYRSYMGKSEPFMYLFMGSVTFTLQNIRLNR